MTGDRPMNHTRLRKLIETLQNLPEDLEFDMGTWFEQKNCGTAACALGAAALDPWHQAQGLRLARGSPHFYSTDEHRAVATGVDAGACYFEIPYSTSHWLFGPDAYNAEGGEPITPEHVIDRINYLLTNADPKPDAGTEETPNA